VEVPLPLLLGAMPVVSCLAFSELAAGRGVPGAPALLCPYATGADNMNAVAKVALTRAVVVILMAYSFSADTKEIAERRRCSQSILNRRAITQTLGNNSSTHRLAFLIHPWRATWLSKQRNKAT
jgi:hypothetical protein